MNLKYISSLNMNHYPQFSEPIKNFDKINKFLNDQLETSSPNELIIFNLQEMYSYRTGIVGWVSVYFTNLLTNYINIPVYLRDRLNSHRFKDNKLCLNDYQILASSICFINRLVPLLNIGVWDCKKNVAINSLTFNSKHQTNPKITECNYLFYDNGTRLFANKPVFASGFQKFYFERVNLLDMLTNKGIEWNYFKSASSKGIMFITYNMPNDGTKIHEIYQIVYLANQLSEKFRSSVLEYETYIYGDLKTQITDGIKNMLLNYKIVNNNDNNYLFHNNSNDKANSITIHYKELFHNPINCVNFLYTKTNHVDIKVIPTDETISEEEESVEKKNSHPKEEPSEQQENSLPQEEQQENSLPEEKVEKKETVVAENKISPVSSVKSSLSDEWTRV